MPNRPIPRGDEAARRLRRAALIPLFATLVALAAGIAMHWWSVRLADPALAYPFAAPPADIWARLPVRPAFPPPCDSSALRPAGAGDNPHHPCLSSEDWILALYSRRRAEPDPGGECRLGSGLWIDGLSGRVETDPAEMTAEPVIPVGSALAAGLSPEGAARLLAPGREDADLWIPLRRTAAEARAGRGIGEWRPASSRAACRYAMRWSAAKLRLGLSVTETERRILVSALSACRR